MDFGERLTKERKNKHLSKADLSKLVGVHYSQLGRYERNEASPSADMLKKLANALEVTTDYLMNGTSKELATETIKDKKLISLFHKISDLSDDNKDVVIKLIDAFIFQQETKKRLA